MSTIIPGRPDFPVRQGHWPREPQNTDRLVLAFVFGAGVALFAACWLLGFPVGAAAAIAGASLAFGLGLVAAWDLVVLLEGGRESYRILPWHPARFPIPGHWPGSSWINRHWHSVLRFWPGYLMIVGLLAGHRLWT